MPLESICRKQIYKVPKRLQSMIITQQPFDLGIKWSPGVSMLIADHLTRSINLNAKKKNSNRNNDFVHISA